MAITFERIINMSTHAGNVDPTYVGSMMIANEPDNNINNFYMLDDYTKDKNSKVVYSNYTELTWKGPNVSLTTHEVRRIGVKSYAQQGAIAFFVLKDEERSKILAPVYIKKVRYTPPGFSLTQTSNKITFTMTEPADIHYICWRVVMRCSDTAFEYISYDETFTIDNPYLSGTYDCYCVGYAGEGEAVSDDSEHITIDVVGSGVDPLDKVVYYTRAEIDAMIGNIAAVLDRINGEVI